MMAGEVCLILNYEVILCSGTAQVKVPESMHQRSPRRETTFPQLPNVTHEQYTNFPDAHVEPESQYDQLVNTGRWSYGQISGTARSLASVT